MVFREGETKDFPFDWTDRSVWYGIIVMGADFPRYAYTSSKSGKADFVEKLKQLKQEGQKYFIIGVWQGNWKTDIFVLDEDIALKKIKKVLV